MVIVSFSSCSDDEKNNKNERISYEEITVNHKTVSSEAEQSIGERHNYYLEKVYNVLSLQSDLNSSNIHSYIEKYFLDELNNNEANTSIAYYNEIIMNPVYDYSDVLPISIQHEINNLNALLDNSDFENEEELRYLINTNTPVQRLSAEDEMLWNNYTDVFVNSFVYWADNITRWESLMNKSSNFSNTVTLKENPCRGKKFLARMWCYIKPYAVTDASAAAGAIIRLGLVGDPIVFGGVAAAAAGASIAKAIIDVVF